MGSRTAGASYIICDHCGYEQRWHLDPNIYRTWSTVKQGSSEKPSETLSFCQPACLAEWIATLPSDDWYSFIVHVPSAARYQPRIDELVEVSC